MTSTPLRRTLLAAALCAAALPAAADASTITREADGTLVYTAGPGADNSMSVQGTDDRTSMTFYGGEADAATAWPDGCSSDSLYGGRSVTCAWPTAVRVDAGDGDDWIVPTSNADFPITLLGGPGADRLESAHPGSVLDGGAGSDTLTGGKGPDVLRGGDGNDKLAGNDGSDRLEGGAGDDVLMPDGYERVNADVVDGGPGFDSVEFDYSSRFDDVDPPVTITLAGGADDGRPDERDDLQGVEKVWLSIGGSFTGTEGADELRLAQVGTPSVLTGLGGNDRLRGGDGEDRLDGGVGDDHLDAGFGDDRIVGGPGRDTIFGDLAGGDCGPAWCKYPYGNDMIEARDGEVDSITCGAGTDIVEADAQDVVAPDCEDVRRAAAPKPDPTPGPGKDPVKPDAGGGARPVAAVPVVRLGRALSQGFTVRLTGAPRGGAALVARRAGRIVARGTATVPASGRATVRLRFTAAARRSLRRSRSVRLVVSGAGVAPRTVTLRR